VAITNNGLVFYPLYWFFHDQWQYYTPPPTGSEYMHWGHLHFWMLGYNPNTAQGGDAFSGSQQFSFHLSEDWGPTSSDPNQSSLYTIIGKPKWFFNVQELWRRVYVQPWDSIDNAGLGNRGIKYDASAADMRMGPFREGLEYNASTAQRLFYAPYWMAGARSLPVEYYRDAAHLTRDNYVLSEAQQLLTAAGQPFDPNCFCIPGSNNVPKGSPGGFPPYSDALYIWPIIEYQKVQQLNWEPLPGRPADVSADDADATYGDGYDAEVSSPFINPTTGKYQSPFAVTPGQVLDFGQYNELTLTNGTQLVPTANRLRYSTVQYTGIAPYTSVLQMPPSDSGQLVTSWHNPYRGIDGGSIVQQCLGGIIQARTATVVSHKLGGRMKFWSDTMTYVTTTPFEGSDQDTPASS